METLTFLQTVTDDLRAMEGNERALRQIMKCFLYDALSEGARPIRVESVRRLSPLRVKQFVVTVRGPAKAIELLRGAL